MLCEGFLGGENAAFDSNGELLGVAGIDVFIVELGTLAQSVQEALHQRVVGNYVPLNNSMFSVFCLGFHDLGRNFILVL
jgi:hypothetical protein